MNKKNKGGLLIVCLFALSFTSVTAQVSGIIDSPFIAKAAMPQQKDFWNNTYNFPAKPRNQWEVGASFGVPTISGDIPVMLPTFGFSAHVRKSLGYLFSIRVQYLNGTTKGMMWQPAVVNSKNTAWLDNGSSRYPGNLPSGKGYNGSYRNDMGGFSPISPTLNGGRAQLVYYNYKTNIQDLSLQGIISINNLRFHKDKAKIVIYGGAGIGISAYNVMVNALGADGNNYTTLFNDVFNATGRVSGIKLSNRKNIRKLLKDGMDNTYETNAETDSRTNGRLGNNVIRPNGTVLFGVTYKLSKNINLALEDRHTIMKTDLLDGQQWQVHSRGDVVLTRDFDSWNFLSLGLNVNLGAKSVEPLWWLNPIDYAYNELNNPKHMKLPKITFEDIDGDGVIDQLDKEPNTPIGYPVDAQGVSKDTDGDGVPDWKDKQLITPTECQPVDGDGVGRCTETECCKTIITDINTFVPKKNCPDDYPSFLIKGLSLNSDHKSILTVIANKLKNNSSCNIVITSYPKTNKRQQAQAEKKMELVKNYLTNQLGISADRISSNSILEGGDPDTIDIKSN